MSYAVLPLTHHFLQSLESIRKDHPYAEEIAYLNFKEDILELLYQIDLLSDSRLKKYAVSLRNSRLKLIFHALAHEITIEQKDKLLVILSLRIKKRFFHYNWIMLQEHYTNAYLIESFRLLIDYMEQNYPVDLQRSLAGKITDWDGDLIEQALEILVKEECTISVYLEQYKILKDSSFARELIKRYFLECSSEGFHANADVFLEMICQNESRCYAQVNHYLNVVNVLDYIEAVNKMLMELYGLPGESFFWDNIQEEVQSKFHIWYKLRGVRKYWGTENEKFLFWRNYYNYIIKTEFIPEQGMMFIYLPGYVVVDFKEDKTKSYLYKKSEFLTAYKTFESEGGLSGNSNWPLDSEKAVPVKNNILEGINSEIFTLDYEGISKLYIRDYLEMHL